MSERKMDSRIAAIALGLICIVLAGFSAYLVAAYNSKQNNLNIVQNQNNQLQTWLTGNETLLNQTEANNIQLQAWLDGNKTLLRLTESWLNGNVTYYNSTITSLQNQLSNFTSAKLGLSNLTVEDNRTSPQAPSLYISGVVYNSGTSNSADSSHWPNYAYFGSISVKAYHADGSTAIDTWHDLDNIGGQSSINVTFNIGYSGAALASWTIYAEIVWAI
jgi:hypothetical protein